MRLCQLPGQFFGIVVEAGDSIAAVETAIGFPILVNPLDDSVYGQAEFVPLWEFIEDHGTCYEVVFAFSDDDGTAVFIPKLTGVDAKLLALCADFC